MHCDGTFSVYASSSIRPQSHLCRLMWDHGRVRDMGMADLSKCRGRGLAARRLAGAQTVGFPDIAEFFAVRRTLPHIQSGAATACARAAAVGDAYSEPSSRRKRPSWVTVTSQRSPLRGRSHTKVSPGISRPAATTCLMVTRCEPRVCREPASPEAAPGVCSSDRHGSRHNGCPSIRQAGESSPSAGIPASPACIR